MIITEGDKMYSEKQVERYFRIAKQVSVFSDYPHPKMGAVIVYKNRIISTGFNSCKENPLQMKYNYFRDMVDNKDSWKNKIHAEIMALSKIKEKDIDFKKVSIFVYRQYKNGDLALAKPCKACEQALKDFGIRDIYYTGDKRICHEHIFR
jgi:deoxycytidylate deaminase